MPFQLIQLTPRGTGGIAVLLAAGSDAGGAIAQLAGSTRASNLQPGEAMHTPLLDPDTRMAVDDVVLVRRAQDHYELHLHGGIAVMDAIAGLLVRMGGTRMDAPEAVQRGLLENPLEGAIALALGRAQTMTGVRLLASQRRDGLARWAAHWRRRIQPMGNPAELWPLQSAAQWLLTRSRSLSRLLDPPRIAIIGPPNAGKSTLANALLGRPSSITSDVPGTTRDWVEAAALFETESVSAAVTLVDTAGLRATPDVLEQESIARSYRQAARADLVILVVDAGDDSGNADIEQFMENAGGGGERMERPVVVALNKVDLPGAEGRKRIAGAIEISAMQRTGLDRLMLAVLRRLDLHDVRCGEPFAFEEWQRSIVRELSLSSSSARSRELLDQLAPQELDPTAFTD
jgi:tRNA modification GTPase